MASNPRPITATQKRQYILAPRRGVNALTAGIRPMSVDMLKATIRTMDLEVVKTITRERRTIDTLSLGAGEGTDLTVVRIEPDRAQVIQATLPPQMLIVEDKPLSYGHGGSPQMLRAAPMLNPFAFSPDQIVARKVAFKVVGELDKPLANVAVQLCGDGFPASGQTDAEGDVSLVLTTLGTGGARSLIATPHAGYWDLYLTNPTLDFENTNLIRLRGLGETIGNFPQSYEFGWNQRLMGLDRLPRELGGAGVKIAIIDSGCDNTHPLLRHVKLGQNYGDGGAPGDWNKDYVGHGTHCAGIITAKPADGTPMRGFAPDADVHILRIFPGGQYSSLIEAIDYCIKHEIDVINMSLGGDTEINAVVEETLQAAVMNGIVCIVAAGNSGDAVRYPASSPQALAVAAVGSANELLPSTWDSTTLETGLVAGDGVFSPSFTCHGPQIGVCAPGVGIVSTVPGGQFEPQSGTSMAAPHVTGLVALLFAHHPVLRAQFPKRDANRVRAAFSILQSLCKTSYAHFGAERTGAGLPSLEAVIGTLVQAAQQQPQVGFAQPSFIPQASLSPQGVLTPQGVTPSAIGAATPSTVATELVNQIAQLIGGAVSQAITAAIRSTPVPPVVDDRVGLANSPSPARSRR